MSRPPVRLTATPSQTVGPFFHFGLANKVELGCLVGPETKGERIQLRLRVLDGDGAPVPDALIEVWQANADGDYVRPEDPARALQAPAFSGFGRLATDGTGTCTFETIRPGRVATPAGTSGNVQASHINVCLFARGLLRHLYTRVYFDGDPELDRDPILGLVSEERRHTLIARCTDRSAWSLDIRLQGEGETVFFDF
jgi:protocatechuate 3,4-dioxygenase, alpha subunit